MTLEHFDDGRFSAAENMARDLLLLENHQGPGSIRLRHYDWEPDCFTFGYSQCYEWIKGQAIRGAQLARRPTGGGLVDHRADWTYALAISPEHPDYRANALEVYRKVHNALALALESAGKPATLQPKEEEGKLPLLFLGSGPKHVRGLCFSGAETYDVIDPVSRKKIAGAAMKRNKSGLLMQGSVDRHVTGDIDWTIFRNKFVGNLATEFDAEKIGNISLPVYPKNLLSDTIKKFSSDAWNKRR